MDNDITKSRSVITGVVGFWLGGILGNFATFLIIISGSVGWILAFLPEEQSLVRLLFAIVLAFVTVGLGGVVTGVFNGWALNRIDTGSDLRQLLVGAGYAYGVSQGILLIPMLLVISLIALYNNGSKSQPQAYLLLFGLFGLVYGLIIGLILAPLTVNFKRMWGVLLAFVFGYLLGGILLGFFLWQADLISSGSIPLRAILRLVFMSLLANIPAGALVGLAFHRLAENRSLSDMANLRPGRVQRGIVIGLSLLALLIVVGFIQNAEGFLTVNTAATATQLTLETVGVHWIPTSSIPVNAQSEVLSPPDISTNTSDFVGVAWSQELDDGSDIFYVFQETGSETELVWSESINVSNSPSSVSTNSGIIMDNNGHAHLIWEELDPGLDTSQIFYSQCQEANCLPPVLLSTNSDLACAEGLSRENNRWPSITIDKAGQLMTAWNAGDGYLLYSTWSAGEAPPQNPSGCIFTAGDTDGTVFQTHLTGGSEGVFAIAYSTGGVEDSGDVYLQRFENGTWSSEQTPIGAGFTPDVMLDFEDQVHVAWCDEGGQTNYKFKDGSTESISSPSCLGWVVMGQDSEGSPHLVWFSDEVANVYGVSSSGNFLYESIRTENGWSNPAIVSQTSAFTQPALASQSGSALHLAWSDAQVDVGSINYTRQDDYQCDVNTLTKLGKVALETMLDGGFHPAGYQVPYCNNRFIDFIYQPNPKPAFSSDHQEPNGGFDVVAELAENVQYEVLFVNMEWDEDENNLSPGSSFARGVANLYQRIKADPSQYPRGIQVRILLGNYPEASTLEWGTQIWNVMNDLRDAGVDELENAEIGWKVEVADYAGTYPHSHTKFMILDGKLLLGAGFNYGWLHLPADHPSGKGEDLVDLGMVVLGPVAQAAISAYDDMWLGANKLHCSDFHPTDGSSWTETCQWSKATANHVPEVLKYYQADSQYNAFSLFRTLVYKEADETYAALLESAQASIDAIHVNFSLELICIANLLVEDLCTFDNALPWMEAIVNAVEENQVKVRVIVENANSNGLENRVAIQVLTEELKHRGLEDFVEIRFFNGRVHAKTALIDQELLVVGSQNFHYSSWGERGLNEFSVATDDPEAIDLYQDMFEYFWELAILVEEADWATAK